MRHFLRSLSIALLCVGLISSISHAATIVILNNDGAGEGFNDPTPVAPVGGNPGTTLGQQRLNAFTYAANLWGARLQSGVTITIRAQMNPLTCTASSAILGSAGAVTVHANFPNAPAANTWYCQALANSLANTDLDPTNPDINATFNSNLNGDPGCLSGIGWYYGYDGNTLVDIDFVTVVTHEIGHGLGFQTFVSLSTGQKFMGLDDTYMLNLDRNGATPSDYPSMTDGQRVSASTSDPNLRWVGTDVTAYALTIPITSGKSGSFVRVHAPSTQQPGSSVSHFSTAVVPNEIMEPSYTGPNHNIELTLQLMSDIGWNLVPLCNPGTTTVADIDTMTVSFTPTTWHMKVKVQNTGSFPANNVTATMSGGPGWLSITDGAGVYPSLAPGASAFNTDDYVLDITNWPGGSFTVDLDVSFEDDCGGSHNQIVSVDMLPTTPTPVTPQPHYVNRLDVNIPNPFNPSTTIQYELKVVGPAAVRVYDVSGRLVRTLVDGVQSAGAHETRWDGRDERGQIVSSGVYFYRLEAGTFTQTRKMVLLK